MLDCPTYKKKVQYYDCTIIIAGLGWPWNMEVRTNSTLGKLMVYLVQMKLKLILTISRIAVSSSDEQVLPRNRGG